MSAIMTKISKSMSAAGQELFNQRLVRKAFTKGQTVLEKGDSVSGAYFVLDGALRIFTLSPSGKQATLYRVEPGETCVLALNSLFNDMLYPAWVEADGDTTIGVLPGPAYRSLFSTETPIQDITIHALSSAVFGLMQQLEQRHGLTVEQRLINFLFLRAASDCKVRNTQQEIALEIGTTREVIGRLMAQMADEGLVSTGRGVITLLDRPRLNALLQDETN